MIIEHEEQGQDHCVIKEEFETMINFVRGEV